jgi:hypothetical protein
MGKRKGREYDNDNKQQNCQPRTVYCKSAATAAALEGYRHIAKSTDSTADKYWADNNDKPNFSYYKDLGKRLAKRGWWSR